MAKYACLFIFMFYLHEAEFISRLHKDEHRRSLYFARHLRDELSSARTLTIDLENDLKGKGIPAFLQDIALVKSRQKRQADGSNAHEPNSTVYEFSDSHAQMIVHWAGKKSDFIVALTKGTVIGGSGEHSSSVHVSYNYGETFSSLNNKLKLSNGSNALISQYFPSPIFNSHYIFADETDKVIFITQNYCRAVRRVSLPFRLKKLRFHQHNAEYILGMDNSDDSDKTLYLSTDFGNTWREIQRDVKSFYWEDDKYVGRQYSSANHSNCIYVHRTSYNDNGNIIRSCDFFQSDSIALLQDVHDFEIQHQYMFATKQVRLLGGHGVTHQIWVSHYRGEFYNAEFPHDLTHLDYYIVDTSEDQIMMCVNHEPSSSHLYISDVNGTKFTLSLEDILYFNPNGSFGASWLRYFEDEPFADIHKVEGMRGVYIVSQLINKTLARDHQRTLITFDKGGEWNLVVAPRRDVHNNLTGCSTAQHCSLHLVQEFDRVSSTIRARPIVSRKSAPGLILATGNMGNKIHVDETAGIYMSTDAGWSWRHVLEGTHFFGIADQGALIVAVIAYVPTNEIVYSTDDGETWKRYKFTETPIRIHGLLNEPGETTTILFLFGSNVSHHSWKTISLNMSNVFQYKCTDDDYKHWSLPDDTEFKGCLMGRKTVYEKRIPRINCYNGEDYERELSVTNCSCTREDFECDFGYSPDGRFGRTHCFQSNDVDKSEIHVVPDPCPIGAFYPYTRGYRKIPGDTCSRGDEHLYAPLMYACPVNENVDEFILFSQMERISRHLMESGRDEVLVQENQAESISAIDYSYNDKCLYWADNSLKKIQRLCEDGNHTVEDLHTTSIGRITALGYDWKGQNIYWIDEEFKSLEVSKPNGRFRRELLRGSRFFDKPRALTIDAHHGLMFWTDVSSTNPRIMKAWMDGHSTSIVTIVNGTNNVREPYGLTIDFESEMLYWTDSYLHRITVYDLHTGNMTILIQSTANLQSPHAIGVSSTSLYWVDYRTNAIMTADKVTGTGVYALDTNLNSIADLKVMHRFSQQGGNRACDLHPCHQLCLLKPPADPDLHGNNRTCRCANNSTRSFFSLGEDEICCISGQAFPNGTCVTVLANSTCSPDKFRCSSGRCIPAHWQCDADNDCGDMSDEINCPYRSCSPYQFQCNNGRCIPRSWHCDLADDCHDNSDELGCRYTTCSADQFSCNNSRCINKNWVCDGDNDCHDYSDEQNCNETVVCEYDEFHCVSGFPRCVPRYSICNGYSNCADGSDERNCSSSANVTCPHWKFTCDNGNCTYRSWVCDGADDCGDNSDERHCTTISTTPYTWTTAQPRTCHYWEFRCNNGYCIPNTERCDGVNDCADFSDEINCGNRTCGFDEFRCHSGDQCIGFWLHCNGHWNCRDGSDESGCASTTSSPICSRYDWRCWNSSSFQCIEASQRCDGVQDCQNNEDEQGCGGGMSCNPKTMFKCRRSEGCIARKEICNDIKNCPDGSDELGCTGTNTTVPTNFTNCQDRYMFHCKYEEKCVPYMFTCDGTRDCVHGSDENLDQCWGIEYRPGGYDIKATSVGKQNMTLVWGAYSNKTVTYIFSYIFYLHGAYHGVNTTLNDSTNNTVINLVPAQKYFINVYVQNGTKVLRPYRKINVTTLDDVPRKPEDVGANYDQNMESVKVTWQPPREFRGKILKYRIYVSKVGSSSDYYFQDVDNTERHEHSETLSPEDLGLEFVKTQNYSITMTAFTSAGEGDKSDTAYFIYGPRCLLSYVGNLTATTRGNNSMELSWQPFVSKIPLDSYKVVYYDSWELKRELHTKDATQTKLIVNNLCAGSWYHFGVVPEKKGCSGDTLYISHKTSGTGVDAPVVKVDAIDVTKLNVSWTIPKGALAKENYTVFYDYRPEDLHYSALETRALHLTSTNTYAIVDNLKACELYTFRVAAAGRGRCPLSDGASQLTGFDPRSPPEDIGVTAINRTAANITWHSSCMNEFEAVGYIVYKKEVYGKQTLAIDQPYTKTDKTELFMVYKNLIPGATYRFTLQTTANNAKQSEAVTLTMVPYDGPRYLIHDPKTYKMDSGKFMWKGDLTQIPKGKFAGYEVLYCDQDMSAAKDMACKDEMFKTYKIVKEEYVSYENLQPGKMYIFAVRLNKIDGYPGAMSRFPLFAVEGEAVQPTQSTVTLNKTNIIAIGVSVAAVIIALVVILAFFIIRHKRLQRSFRAFASSHYEARSGTTTFTAADELGEDEESPMIRGFSDDEPLVIA